MKYRKIKLFYLLLSKHSFKQPNSASQLIQLRFLFNYFSQEKVRVCLLGNSKLVSQLSASLAQFQPQELFVLSTWTPGSFSNSSLYSSRRLFYTNVLVVVGVEKNIAAIREAKQKNIPVICFSCKASFQKYKNLLSYVFFFDVNNLKSIWFILYLIF